MTAWVAPQTATSGTQATAAQFNSQRDNLNWLKGALDQAGIVSDVAKPKLTPALQGCSLRNSGNVNGGDIGGSGAVVAMTWDTEDWDSDGYHSTASNTDRITIPAGLGGYFLVLCQIEWPSNGTGFRRLSLVNGTLGTEFARHLWHAGGSATHFQQAFGVVQLAATDWIYVGLAQTAGAQLSTNNSGGNHLYLVPLFRS